jgi:nucleoside-diphosphate-sugar epimerase
VGETRGGKTVFLTGATGFIGSRVAKLLLRRGDAVRCLVRDLSRATALRDAGATLIKGDITDVATVSEAMRGADAAIHLAAAYDVGVVDSQAMRQSNVEGTRVFLDAVESSDIARALYISTTVALGPVAVGVGDENTEHHSRPSSIYEQTKKEAHALARSAQRDGLPLMIVCPAYVYGPGDNGPGGRFLMDLVRKRVPGLLTRPAWFSFVHVDDVADGIIAVLDAGTPGATYVLSGEDATINAFAERAARLAGVKAPLLRFPPPMARLTGVLLDGITRATRIRFPITRENVDTVAGHRWLHSHAKATAELDWQPRSLDDGLPDTVAWAKSQVRR